MSDDEVSQSDALDTNVITFGCRLNTYESAVISEHLRANHLEGAVVFNTCAVTQEAERKARQSIRQYRRRHPNAKIIVTGCSAQLSPDRYADMPEVDQVLGNKEKMRSESYVASAPKLNVSDIMQVKENSSHILTHYETRTRAIVEIQNGCDHRCTFCTIPLARGNNRSTPFAQVMDQVGLLVQQGYKEVVFTGVDITNYGLDLPGEPSLGQLCQRVLHQYSKLKRLRISSIDAVEVDNDFFDLIANESRLMPHLHISLQAGADLILKRMKRRHLRQDAIDFCCKVRALRPDVTFGADIIVGFPTETDAHFEDSLNLVDECGLTHLHVFPYSPRPDTPAARMPQVNGKLIKERAQLLREKGKIALARYQQACVGKDIEVLMESGLRGHSHNFDLVKMQSNEPLSVGTLIQARVIACEERNLVAVPR
jgi:threonylcarbamoyladenosine tRNA methylthiotransferase MtaB